MSTSFASGIGAIVMAFITMLTSLFGFITNKPDNKVIQGFEPKEEVEMRIMSDKISGYETIKLDKVVPIKKGDVLWI